MSDLKKYVAERKKRDKAFAEGYDRGYEKFRIGVVLKHARETAGLTREALALRTDRQFHKTGTMKSIWH